MTVTVYIWYPKLLRSSSVNAILARNVGHASIEINNTYISYRPFQREDSYQQSLEVTFTSKIELLFQHLHENPNFSKIKFIKELIKSISEDLNIKIKTVFKHIKNKDYSKLYIYQDGVKPADTTNDTYNLEWTRKERPADKIVKIEGLDEDKMLSNYHSWFKKDLYHPIHNNCCTFVANIIRSSLDCPTSYNTLCFYCSKKYSIRSSKLKIYSRKTFFYNLSETVYNLQFYLINVLFTIFYLILLVIFTIMNVPRQGSNLFSFVLGFLGAGILFGHHTQKISIWTPILIKEFATKIEKQKRNKKICLKRKFFL